MSNKYPEYKSFSLSAINREILSVWNKEKTFEKSLEVRQGHPLYVFYEGPPSANGMPGIHHVIARTIKDIFCRYKTMRVIWWNARPAGYPWPAGGAEGGNLAGHHQGGHRSEDQHHRF